MKRKKESYSKTVFFHILGAGLGGWLLATLNIIAELIKGGSIFIFPDIVRISLWHIALWSLAGVAAGLASVSVRIIFHLPRKTKTSNVIIFYLLGAAWLFLMGYANIYYLPGIFSKQALFWNLVLIISGIILMSLLYFLPRKNEKTDFLLLPKILFLILAVITLTSGFSHVFSGKKSNRVITEQIVSGKKHNVIFILLDALRADHLGCYGYNKDTTPNIDRLAAEGVIFDQAFSQSSHTLESVPSYMTSNYPSTHNVRTHTSALPDKLLTLPEIFHSSGYATSIISANPYVSPAYGYHRGVDDFYWLEGNIIKINKTVLGYFLQNAKRISLLKSISSSSLKLGKLFYSSQDVLTSGDPAALTAKAMDWIKDNRDTPFFLYLHYDGAHNPYLSPYGKIFDPGYNKNPVVNFPEGLGMFLPFVKGKPLPPRKTRNMIAQYDGQIFFHDKHLGELFLSLKKWGLNKNTLIVITSDHGEEFYEHQGWGHGQSLYDELIHVPLIIYGEGLIPSGQRISSLVELVDIFPTLLQLCGFSSINHLPYKIEGHSLIPYLKDNNAPARRTFIFSEVTQGGHWAQCLRTETHKAVNIHFGGEERKHYFDLTRDPDEKNNLYKKEGFPGETLFKKLKNTADNARKKSFQTRNTSLDEKQKEQLRSLGYIK